MADPMNTTRTEPFSITQFIIRVVVAAIVLAITAFFTRGFAINGLWSLLLGAIVLSGLDYLASRVLNVNATPFGRGITGFILAAAIIYITQFFVAGYAVTFWGAIIGALIYGIVDAIIPGKSM
ncbi:MAG: phage holin family protein [Clostridia bacterium]|nr:phage holin family protein [Clostridia bacterium]